MSIVPISEKRINELALQGLFIEKQRIEAEIAALTTPKLAKQVLTVDAPPELTATLDAAALDLDSPEVSAPAKRVDRRGGKRSLTAAGRRAISQAKKRWWAQRKKSARR